MLANPTLANLARNASQAKHPSLWAGLQFACYPALGCQGDVLRDFGGKQLNAAATGVTWTKGRFGTGAVFNGSAYAVTPTRLLLGADMTFMGVYNCTGGTFPRVAEFGGFAISNGAGSTLQFSPDANPSNGNFTLGATGDHIFIGRYRAGGSVHDAFCDGTRLTPGTPCTGAIPSPITVYVGNNSSLSRGLVGTVYAVLFWSRLLGDREARLLTNDIFAPIRRKAGSPAASAGSALLLERRRKAVAA